MSEFTPPEHPVVLDHAWTEAGLQEAVVNWAHNLGLAATLEVTAPPVMQGGRPVARRVDVLAVRQSTHGVDSLDPESDPWLVPVDLVTVELKTSRTDFLADVRDSDKRAPWIAMGARHYYATPAGLADPGEVPPECGLLTVVRRRHPVGKEYNVVRMARVAAGAGPVPAPGWLLEQAVRRVDDLTARLRGWVEDPTPVEELHRILGATAADLRAARRQVDAAREQATAWKALASAQGHKVACAHCGRAVVPVRVSAGALTGWRHAQPHLTGECPGNTPGVGVRPTEE